MENNSKQMWTKLPSSFPATVLGLILAHNKY